MSARKYRPVLYEVVQRSDPQRKSAWWRFWSRGEAAPPPVGPTPDVPPAPPPLTPATTPPLTPPPLPRATAPGAVRFVGGHLHLVLGWPAFVVIGLTLLLLLAVAFQAGRQSARPRPSTADPVQTPVTGPGAATDLPQRQADRLAAEHRLRAQDVRVPTPPGGRDTTAAQPPVDPRGPIVEPPPPPPTIPDAELREGQFYVVVQHFRRSAAADAQVAADFLRQNGIPAVIRTGADLRLIAAVPFDLGQADAAAVRRERQRCDDLKAQIRALGQEFRKLHGYDFSSPREQRF